MLTQALILSLQIIAIKVSFMEGMWMGWFQIGVANILDRIVGLKWSRYIQKPLWDCFPCMASLWVMILSGSFVFDFRSMRFNTDLMLMILLVSGINFIIDIIIPDYESDDKNISDA